jgi:shikimate kinase
MNNLIITGFMATGKTAVAKLLAARLGKKFIDTDQQIERYAKKSVSEIFDQEGEERFRKLEKNLLHWLIHYDKVVISTGGGMIANPDNLKTLKKMGKIICLTADPQVILERIKHNTHRPLLNDPDPLSKIMALFISREPYYMQADYTVDTSRLTIEEVVDLIVDWLGKFPPSDS